MKGSIVPWRLQVLSEKSEVLCAVLNTLLDKKEERIVLLYLQKFADIRDGVLNHSD